MTSGPTAPLDFCKYLSVKSVLGSRHLGTYICILKRIVTVIPSRSILGSTPPIRETISLSNGTLCHTIDTVHLVGVELSNTMPVHCGTILIVIIFHVNHDLISPASLNQRRRKRVIEDFSCRLFEAVGCELNNANCSVIQTRFAPIQYGRMIIYRDIAIKLDPILNTHGQ